MFEETSNIAGRTGAVSRTTVGELAKTLKRQNAETEVVCELESPMKGLWLNKRTTVGRVLELLADFDGRIAVTVRLTTV